MAAVVAGTGATAPGRQEWVSTRAATPGQAQARALGDPTRHRIFGYVAQAHHPVGVAELTELVGLNHNAVRQHLIVLRQAGLVLEEVEARTRPGRPRLFYQLNPEARGTWETDGPYALLAALLSEAARTHSSPREVGRRVGKERALEMAASGTVAALGQDLVAGGFRPRAGSGALGCEFVLQRCAFAAVAAGDPAICQLHLGMVEGIAEGFGERATVESGARGPPAGGVPGQRVRPFGVTSGLHLFTVGHGTENQDRLAALLVAAKIVAVVDVRSAPGSRRHPQFARQELEIWLPEAGISYRWDPDLGGFRRPSPSSPNLALRHPSFRGYADYMMTEPFAVALRRVLDDAAQKATTVMCAETLWWRCHRRLIADAAALLLGAEVSHLDHAGHREPHRLTEGVRPDPETGLLVYDAPLDGASLGRGPSAAEARSAVRASGVTREHRGRV